MYGSFAAQADEFSLSGHPCPASIGAPLQVQPTSTRYSLVGTAFDYLLRFELQRLVAQSRTLPWIAELSLIRLKESTQTRFRPNDLRGRDGFDREETISQIDGLLHQAREAVSSYCTNSAPTVAEQSNLAAHAVRLAKLDELYRGGFLEPGFSHADPADVDELLQLLKIVPRENLVRGDEVRLNPTFGQASQLVRGADADFITGNTLVDIKVTKRNEFAAEHLDQLLGYFLLSRDHRADDPAFPEIEHVGIYFARHGYLWTMPTAIWTGRPMFPRVERQFFELAREVYSDRDNPLHAVESLIKLGYTRVVAAMPLRHAGRYPYPHRIVREDAPILEESGSTWRVVLATGAYAVGEEGSIDLLKTEAEALARLHTKARLVRHRWRRSMKIRTAPSRRGATSTK